MITARELKWALKRYTRCSTRKMVVLDKKYASITRREVLALIKDYKKDSYIPEIWDCDDIARDFTNFVAKDFVNYVKKQVKNILGKNVAFGMVVFRDHAQEIFVNEIENVSKYNRYVVQYMDHRNWRIYAPNERPKWIVI